MEPIGQLLAVVLVLALLGILLWLLKRKGAMTFRVPGLAAGSGMLERVDRAVLTPTHSVHLLRVADRAVVIAAHTGGCTLLESRPWEEVANRTPGGAR